MNGSPRTLHVKRDAPPSRDRACSREEALSWLMANEYDAIVLHTRTPGCDDYQLVDYLAGTWPHFLQTLTVRTACGGTTHLWNPATARFEPEPAPPPRPRRVRDRRWSGAPQAAAPAKSR